MGKMYSGLLWIWKSRYDRSAWYVADAKIVWSLINIVESGAEFYIDSRAVPGWEMMRVGGFRLMLD